MYRHLFNTMMALILAFSLTIGLVGCGDSSDSPGPLAANTETQTEGGETGTEGSESSGENGESNREGSESSDENGSDDKL